MIKVRTHQSMCRQTKDRISHSDKNYNIVQTSFLELSHIYIVIKMFKHRSWKFHTSISSSKCSNIVLGTFTHLYRHQNVQTSFLELSHIYIVIKIFQNNTFNGTICLEINIYIGPIPTSPLLDHEIRNYSCPSLDHRIACYSIASDNMLVYHRISCISSDIMYIIGYNAYHRISCISSDIMYIIGYHVYHRIACISSDSML